jgi:light-regulated signal transduction histidine kinase (bacteriophytochrome)
MGDLIEGLLDLSHCGRKPLVKKALNLKSLVRQIFDELHKDSDGRQVEIRVGDIPDCIADRTLIKQVFVNLLSNALKYTRQKKKAIIEVGCQQENGTPIYFIRDNGAGFDMEYVQKLFGVFQRLHSAEEFEGTGVGLSIVQRIVQRHGGRIWAEGKVEKGATFYFTLSQPTPLVPPIK